MPKSPSMDDRICWHLDHERECACRPMPDRTRKEIERRKRDAK